MVSKHASIVVAKLHMQGYRDDEAATHLIFIMQMICKQPAEE